MSLYRAKYNVLTPSSYTSRKQTYLVAAMWLAWWQALQDKALSNDSPPLIQKLTQKIWILFTTGNGRLLFAFRTKLH